MAIVFDAPLSPDAQTAYIREVPISRGNPLLGQVPITTQYDQFFEWSEITRKNQTAEYRSFDGRIKVTERDSLAGKRVPLAPFSDSLNLGEYERLQIEFMRTGGTRDAARKLIESAQNGSVYPVRRERQLVFLRKRNEWAAQRE